MEKDRVGEAGVGFTPACRAIGALEQSAAICKRYAGDGVERARFAWVDYQGANGRKWPSVGRAIWQGGASCAPACRAIRALEESSLGGCVQGVCVFWVDHQ